LYFGFIGGYDLFVVDCGLFVIEGVDFVWWLCGCVVIVLVLLLIVCGIMDDWVEGLDVGVEDYLVKFFDVDELLAWLRVLLCCYCDFV